MDRPQDQATHSAGESAEHLKLILVDEDGNVLDSTQFSKSEWQGAVSSPVAAWSLLAELDAGR
jgi:hypothetical protein